MTQLVSLTLGRNLTLTDLEVGGVARATVPFFDDEQAAIAAGLLPGGWYATPQQLTSYAFAVVEDNLMMTETVRTTGLMVVQTVGGQL